MLSYTSLRQTNFLCAALIVASLLVGGVAQAVQSSQVRIKDIASVSGASGQKVMGYGLVVGLNGTGDSKKSVVTQQAMANMLEHFDLKVATTDLTIENVAAVMVTATLPAAARSGDRIDVTVASMGDATSIYGGILLPTPMLANDGDVYVIAQGAISIGGFSASSGGQKAEKGHPVAGVAVNSGDVIKTVPPSLAPELVSLTLRQPDFTTATRVAEAINTKLGASAAKAVAAESVEVSVPEGRQADIVGFISEIEGLSVVGDTPARVVVNERTGTVIIGGDVRIMPVAIAHGSLTITVKSGYDVSQPAPFSGGTTIVRPEVSLQGGAEGAAPAQAPATEAKAEAKPAAPRASLKPAADTKSAQGGGAKSAEKPGAVKGAQKPATAEPATAAEGTAQAGAEVEAAHRPPAPQPGGAQTVVTPRTELDVEEQPASLIEIPTQTRLGDLVDALNSLGVKPRDLIAILEALRTANALQAELVLM